jgi:hypothetical protein
MARDELTVEIVRAARPRADRHRDTGLPVEFLSRLASRRRDENCHGYHRPNNKHATRRHDPTHAALLLLHFLFFLLVSHATLKIE